MTPQEIPLSQLQPFPQGATQMSTPAPAPTNNFQAMTNAGRQQASAGRTGGTFDVLGTLASSIFKGVQSRKQRKMAEQLIEENPRPTYQTPEALDRALAISQGMSTQGLPAFDVMGMQLDQGTQTGARMMQQAAGSPAELLAGLGGLYSQNLTGRQSLAIQNAQSRQQNLLNYQNALQQFAPWQDKQFMMNTWQPYEQAAAAASALTQAADMNRYQAITEGVGIGDSVAQTIASIYSGGALG